MSTDLLLNQLASSSSGTFSSSMPSSSLTISSNDSFQMHSHSMESEEQRLEALLLPALAGHEALPIHLKVLYDSVLPLYSRTLIPIILARGGWNSDDFQRGYISQLPPSNPTSWRCANIPTTLQILIQAKKYHPNMFQTIDSLQKSLTQTILVSLVNTSNNNGNLLSGVEMPMIASLAPNNTSLHTETIMTLMSTVSDVKKEDDQVACTVPQILHMPLSRQESPHPAPSPTTSTTETESVKSSNLDDGRSPSVDCSDQSLQSRLYKNNKKRVQCDLCLHTFCDKGALKIHTSSVHLREMHICTIPGCNKQFPSKRSRNRHSNNPNMHTETGRRRNCRTIMSSIPTPSEPSTATVFPPEPQMPQMSTNMQILPLLQKVASLASSQPQSTSAQPFDIRHQLNHQQAFQPSAQALNLAALLQNSGFLFPRPAEILPQVDQQTTNVVEMLKMILLQRQKSAIC